MYKHIHTGLQSQILYSKVRNMYICNLSIPDKFGWDKQQNRDQSEYWQSDDVHIKLHMHAFLITYYNWSYGQINLSTRSLFTGKL